MSTNMTTSGDRIYGLTLQNEGLRLENGALREENIGLSQSTNTLSQEIAKLNSKYLVALRENEEIWAKHLASQKQVKQLTNEIASLRAANEVLSRQNGTAMREIALFKGHNTTNMPNYVWMPAPPPYSQT